MPTRASATSRCSKCRAPMRATRRTASAASPPACGAARPSSKAPAATGPAMPAPVGVFDAKADALRRARSLRRAGRQAADRGRRPGLVSSGPLRHDQARAEDRARAFRRVPSEDAGRRSTFPARLRLRSLSSTPCPSRSRSRRAPSRSSNCRRSRRSGATSPSSSTGGRGRHADARRSSPPTAS